jgi:soluble lytic murein transglycosylase-like protein
VIEFPGTAVVGFEQVDYVAPPVSPPLPDGRGSVKASVVQAATPTPKQLLQQAANRYGLPPEILLSVAKVESAYDAKAISPKGAVGIMQLMPGTAARLNADPYDAAQNVDAGARHLRDLLVQYDGAAKKALAAYNAGQGAVEKYNGVPPYAETQLYVEKVLQNYHKLTGNSGSQ